MSHKFVQLIITELFIPTHKVLPIFCDYGYSTSSMMTHSGVREVVTTYIRERELVSPTDSKWVSSKKIVLVFVWYTVEVLSSCIHSQCTIPLYTGPVTLWCILSISRIVVLDPTLTDAVLRKGEPPPTQLSWQQIITRILEEMRPGYSIQRNDENLVYKLVVIQLFTLTATYFPPPPPHTHTNHIHTPYIHTLTHSLRRSKLEPVRLSVTTRTGNKKATLVDNLEYYGIAPTDIVHQVQRIAAASATGIVRGCCTRGGQLFF